MSTGSNIGSIGGGAVGSFFGPAGTVIGAGIGGAIGGLFGGSDEYRAPSFSDVDLKTANPELWAQLQKELALADQAESLYNQRRQGMTYGEQAGLNEALSSSAQRQASMGQLGSAVGNAQQADAEARLRSSIAQHAFGEQQQLLQNAQQARSQYAQQLLGGQQAVIAPQTQQAQINYQNQQQENQAQNQFYSGLMNAGLSLYGNSQNIAAQQALNDQRVAAMYQSGTPGGYSGPMARGYDGGYSAPMGYTPPTYGAY